LGFIGAGWWATENHMPVLAARPDVELAAVCRLGEAELQQVKERFGFKFATQDYRELLEQPLDGVVVSTPHHLHYEHARAALERGLPVMVEKPMTLKADQAWELVRLAQERNLEIVIPYGWHYKPINQRAKQLMEEGLVGEIEYVLCHMASPTKELMTGRKFEYRTDRTVFEADLKTWSVPEQGGGYLHGQVTHSTGLMFWLTGLRARTVTALLSTAGGPADLYDAIAVRFREGALGTVSGAGTVPLSQTFQVDIRIFGSEGMLLLDLNRAHLAVHRHDGRSIVEQVAPDAGAYSCEGPPNRFVDLIQGKPVRNDSPGEVGARSVELLDAAVRSAASGQVVEITG